MAGVFVTDLTVNPSGDNLELKLDMVFFASGLKDLSVVTITISPADTLAQVKAAIVAAIQAEATRLSLNVPAANMILPAFQKGA